MNTMAPSVVMVGSFVTRTTSSGSCTCEPLFSIADTPDNAIKGSDMIPSLIVTPSCRASGPSLRADSEDSFEMRRVDDFDLRLEGQS